MDSSDMTEMPDRCPWCGTAPIYIAYHDTEWGVPEHDPRALWEKLVLDGFQAGLSWITILKKRDNFRAAFDGFEPEIIARWGPDRVSSLLRDAGIVRHRGKIEATITNARAYLEMSEDFDAFFWSFVGGTPLQPRHARQEDVPTETAGSRALSKALKARGFRFCGPTIVHAWMEACGLVNDHLVTCHRHDAVAQMGQAGTARDHPR